MGPERAKLTRHRTIPKPIAIGIEIGAKKKLDDAGCPLKFDSATNMFCFDGECKSGFREYTPCVY